jgi:hypothetical protein
VIDPGEDDSEALALIESWRSAIRNQDVFLNLARIARHESSHALVAFRRFGGRGAVAFVSLRGEPAALAADDLMLSGSDLDAAIESALTTVS